MFGNLLCQVQGIQDVKGSIKTLLDVLETSLGCKHCWALSRIGNTAMRETSWSIAPNSKVSWLFGIQSDSCEEIIPLLRENP